MREETITVYSFNELSDKAKERAREWYREIALSYEWWDAVYDDCAAIFRILGIESTRRVTGRDGKIKDAGPEIYFSGFSSQGDGACFVGRYRYAKGAAKAIRAYAPQDKELHDIADRLQELQRKHAYQIEAKMTHSGRYNHENSIEFEIWRQSWRGDSPFWDDDERKEFRFIMRSLMRWIYRKLEAEYEYLISDEAVDESILANDYEFTASGEIH